MSASLTVLFVAWVKGWLWWLLAGAAVLCGAVVGARWYERRRHHLASITERADQQHAWVLAGDPRGTHGGANCMEPNGRAARLI